MDDTAYSLFWNHNSHTGHIEKIGKFDLMRSHNHLFLLLSFLCLATWTYSPTVFSQDKKPRVKYFLGEEQKLQIHVHIWGEVNKPGNFIVPDGTNIIELISLAGGPTQYANLSNVQVTRQAESLFISKEGLLDIVSEAEQHNISKESLEKSLKERFSHRIIKVNVKRYLEVADAADVLPTLKPGDVVRVKQNFWYKWRAMVRVASEIAIIASVYVWYMRAEQWN